MSGTTRRSFIGGGLATTQASLRGEPGGGQNVLLVVADQFVPFLSGVYGHPVVQTPNLDRLAARGVRFDAAYSPNPLCAPARACLITGRHSSAIRVHDNASPLNCDEPTVAHYLNNAGYDTAAAGKMHFVGPDQHHGYRGRISPDIYPADFSWTKRRENKLPRAHARSYLGQACRIVEPGEELPRNQVLDEDAHRAGLAYLDARGKDRKPFFLTVSYNYPHEPFHAPRDLWDLYEGADINVPEYPDGFQQRLSAMDRWLNRHHGADKIDVKNPASIRRMRRAYYALVTYVDRKLGELVESLERHGLAGHTNIIFTADHGDMLAEKGMVQKRCFYEWSARVPMLMALPDGRHAGTRNQTPASLIDVAPTILELAGLEQDGRIPMDGRSLLPYLPRPDAERTVFSESHSEGVYATCFMARRGRWKYVYIHGHEGQLFDVVGDPFEWNNLVGNPEHRRIEEELRAAILREFSPDAIEADLRASIARRELVRRSMGETGTSWDFEPDALS